MIRLLVRALVYFGSSAIGLLVADWILDDMSLTASGFLITVAIFALAQTILTPFIFKVVRRNANAFIGGIGILSTLVALMVAHLIGDSLSITGIGTWFLAAVVVWFASALATFFLPAILVKAGIERARTEDDEA